MTRRRDEIPISRLMYRDIDRSERAKNKVRVNAWIRPWVRSAIGDMAESTDMYLSQVIDLILGWWLESQEITQERVEANDLPLPVPVLDMTPTAQEVERVDKANADEVFPTEEDDDEH